MPRRAERRIGDAAVVRAEVARLRRGLDRIDAALEELQASEPLTRGRARPERYYRLLVDVYEYGRHGTSSTTFIEHGRSREYDARGLGGFFLGRRAPLRRRDGRVLLTPEGHRLVENYLEGVGP